jgi:plasmid stability protein
MLGTCDNVVSMAKMIQIRNVPEPVHRTLKTRAAQAGMTLSDFLLAEVEQIAKRPTIEELTERIQRRSPVAVKGSSASVIRRHRDAR